MMTDSRRTPKCSLVIPILALAVACGPSDDTADSQQFSRGDVTEYTIEQFMETTNVFGSSFSPDGSKILVSTDETGILNAYAIPVAGGDPIPLTSSTSESIRVASYFPDDERFIYMADVGGNELDHVYARELDGSVTDITPGEGLKAWFGGWAKDDQTFFVGSNERDNRFFDIYEVTVDGYEKTLIYQDETGYGFGGISPDERYIAFTKPKTTSDSDIYLYDREAEEMRRVSPYIRRGTARRTSARMGQASTSRRTREASSLISRRSIWRRASERSSFSPIGTSGSGTSPRVASTWS